MKKPFTLITLLLRSKPVFSQSGMSGVGAVIILSFIGLVSVLVLLVSSIKRFSGRKKKADKVLNASGLILIVCSLLSLAILGSEIDSGFSTTCIATVVISVILIILNYKVRIDKTTQNA